MVGGDDMPLSTYDCPTFLGQKDKYLAGLSLPQLMASIGMGAFLVLGELCVPLFCGSQVAGCAPAYRHLDDDDVWEDFGVGCAYVRPSGAAEAGEPS